MLTNIFHVITKNKKLLIKGLLEFGILFIIIFGGIILGNEILFQDYQKQINEVQSANWRLYIISSNDKNLSCIIEKECKLNGVKYDIIENEVCKKNNIKNPNLIYVNQKIYLPINN